jgi:hypothetical protein
VGNLVKYVLNKLKLSEKDILDETEKFTVVNDKGENVEYLRPKALSSRFLVKCI